jgi:hypothetical protein
MDLRVACLLVLCGICLSACGPSGASVQHPIVTTTPPLGAGNTGPTPAQAGPAPPAFDRYGNANYDSSGAYTGGHGVGTQVDNPDASTMGVPKADMPDMSNMHCTGSSIANAGTMNCTSN